MKDNQSTIDDLQAIVAANEEAKEGSRRSRFLAQVLLSDFGTPTSFLNFFRRRLGLARNVDIQKVCRLLADGGK